MASKIQTLKDLFGIFRDVE